MVDLSGRVIAVTGAGSGIGRAIALRLSERGAAVALMGRTAATLEAVAAEATGPARVVVADVVDRSAVDAAFARVSRELGPLHGVIANAGIGGPNDPTADEDSWDAVIRTNLDGSYHAFRSFFRHRARDGGACHAIAISSCVARFGVPGISAYSAAKAGQLGLVRSLAAEWGPHGILVNAICPGWVETQMAVDRMTEIGELEGEPYEATREKLIGELPLQRISEPGEIAGLVEFLLSPAAVAFTGQAFDPNNGAWMG